MTRSAAVYLDSEGITPDKLSNARTAIELIAVQLATESIDEVGITRLRAALEREKAAIRAGGRAGASEDVHSIIARLSGNPAIQVLACTGRGIGGVPARPDVVARLLSPRRYHSPSYLARIAADTYGGKTRSDATLLRAETNRRMNRPPSVLGYVSQLLASSSFSTYPIAPLIRQPTLIIAGGDDPIVRPANQHILHSPLRHSKLEIVDSAGHLLLLEEPQRPAALVMSFLESDR